MTTPWGQSDHQKKKADGITFYGTPSHGGFKLDAERNAKIPEYMRCEDGWYEEDCDWAIVAVVFYEYFRKYIKVDEKNTMPESEHAKDVLRNWHPEYYEKFFGEKIQPGESYKRDEQLFRHAHANDWIVTSAVGDWHEKVPTGFTGCSAHLGGRDARGKLQGKERNFLVLNEEYGNRNGFGFVINTEKHQEVESL